METRAKRVTRVLAALLVLGLAVSTGTSAVAEEQKVKSTQSEGEWVGFDAAANTVKVKIKKAGQGPNKSMLKPNAEAVFKVKPEGTVLTRTSVAINGVRAALKDIPQGKTVMVYWVPEGDALFARKIDVVLSEQELDARATSVE